MTDKTDKTAPAPSLRDSIRSAMDTEKERIADEAKDIKASETDPKAEKQEEVKEEVKQEEVKEEPKEEKSSEPKEPKKDEKEPSEPKAKDTKEATEVKAEEKKPDEKEPRKEVKAPFGVPKGVREKFATLDQDTQEFIVKTAKELHELKSNEGRKTYLKEVDQVLEPYQQALRNINVSPANLVKRLLEYTDALSNPQYQQAAMLNLAKDFNIDLIKLVDDLADSQKTAEANPAATSVPPEVIQKIDAMAAELDSMKSRKTTDNDKAAEDTVNTWAGFDPASNEYKTKPYFPYVRKAMHSLIASGSVPLVNGRIDLDAAYDAACFAHPEIRELIIEDQNKAKEAALREKQQQQVTKAKDAGVSIKPGAPVQRAPVQQKKPGTNKYVPAGESLRAAIAELRNSGRA